MEVMSEAREVRSFIGRNFFSAELYYQFEDLDTVVSQVMSLCFFNHNDGTLLHIMRVRSTSSFLYLDIVLSLVIAFYFATVMAS